MKNLLSFSADNTEVAESVTESAESSTEAPTTIDYPTIKSIENLSEGAKITWDRYGNNTSYRVYYRKAAVYNGTWDEKYSSSGWTRLATVTGNSYTHKDVKDAEIGIYTVRAAVDSNGNFTSNFFNEGWENLLVWRLRSHLSTLMRAACIYRGATRGESTAFITVRGISSTADCRYIVEAC